MHVVCMYFEVIGFALPAAVWCHGVEFSWNFKLMAADLQVLVAARALSESQKVHGVCGQAV